MSSKKKTTDWTNFMIIYTVRQSLWKNDGKKRDFDIISLIQFKMHCEVEAHLKIRISWITP